MAESSSEVRRRLPPERRRADLLQRAAAAFAADGFALTTREVAARCGVTQALLYRYFESKDALIEAVLRNRFLTERAGPDPTLLARDAPLDERLAEFYASFVSGSRPENLRLFLRAALDGLGLPRRYASQLDARVLRPVVEALRREADLPALPAGAFPQTEREVAMALHSLAVFTLIRRDVYGIALPLPIEDLLRLQMRVAVPGAVEEIRRARRVRASRPERSRLLAGKSTESLAGGAFFGGTVPACPERPSGSWSAPVGSPSDPRGGGGDAGG